MKSQFDHIWQRIEQEKIKPLPKWILVSRQIGIWSGFGLSVAFGAMTLSYLVFIMDNMNADILIVSAPFELLTVAPVVWAGAFVLFLGLAFWSVEHTESGYKVHFSLWIIGNLALTSMLALGIVALDVPRTLEPGIRTMLPPFSATHMEERLWHRPETGRIQGEITSIFSNTITIQNPQGEEWLILVLPETRKPVLMEEFMNIRVMGTLIDEKKVEAKMIIPVQKPFRKPLRHQKSEEGRKIFP